MVEDREIFCPICLNLLFRPIVLPCSHTFCKECILQSVEKNKYQCPVCRYRLSNWLRKVKDVEGIICEDLENEIRHIFPSYYTSKELGESPTLNRTEQGVMRHLTDYQSSLNPKICAPGEIHKEYLVEAEKQAGLRALENKKNEEASLALVAQLLAEDSALMYDEFATTPLPNSPQPKCSLGPCCSKDTPQTRTLAKSHSQSFLSNCSNKHSKPTSKPRRTLLEYAVDKRVTSNQIDSKDYGSCDEEFARKLQEEYTKIASNSIRKSLRNTKRKR